MKRFQTADNGYRYDKLILWGGFLAVCLVCVFILSQFGFDFEKKLYLDCKSPTCENPIFFRSDLLKHCKEDWCRQSMLPRGEYGTPPPDSWMFNNFGLIAFLIMVVVVLLNHFIHNNGKTPGLIPNRIPKWLTKLMEKIGDLEE